MNETVTKDYAKLAINKSLLKEYNNSGERIVYLEDGDEFQMFSFPSGSYSRRQMLCML